jgi:hypothetical protein
MPPRSVADTLLDGYLRTFETVYRVLHVPTFRAEYARYWEHPQAANPAFVVLLQLCLAIGACLYFHEDAADGGRDPSAFDHRMAATRWTYEGLLWLILPPEKARLSIVGVQIMCLLQLAKQLVGIGADLTWISAGSLLRTAMYMGLHHDPDNLASMPVYRAEVRRRLWATILEICLQSSVDAGGPPLLSLQDFDTRPPANLDDVQLLEEGENAARRAIPKNPSCFTQTSVQIALLESFPSRLAIASLVNNPQGNVASYDEILKLSAELTSVNRTVMHQLFSLPKDDRAAEGVSTFQLRMVECVTSRFFLTLHLPMLGEALRSPSHYFSRKMCVDTSLKLVRFAGIGTSPAGAVSSGAGIASADDFAHLTTCGAGPYRTVPIQACLVLGLELTNLKEEERRSLGTSEALGTAELYAALKSMVGWTERRIRAGETNVKGHVFGQAILSQIDAVSAGLGNEEVEELIMDQTTICARRCYDMLQGLAGDLHDGNGDGSTPSVGTGMFETSLMDEVLGDWDWDDMVS